MPNIIDVRDLNEEDVKFVEKLVNLLKTQNKGNKGYDGKENIVLGSKESDVIGNLTRREIYDHL